MTYLTKAFVNSSALQITIDINAFLAEAPAKTAINVTWSMGYNGTLYALLLYSQA